MKSKLITKISILFFTFIICLFNINISHANNNEDIPKGDNPNYKISTSYEFYDKNIKSIKALIEKYNIKAKSEERDRLLRFPPKPKILTLTLEVQRNKYGDFIKDLKELMKSNKEMQIYESYEPITLGASTRTLTLKIVQNSKYEKDMPFALIILFVVLGCLNIYIDEKKREK